MARRRREEQPIGVGMTARQMKRKKPINHDIMREIEPLTKNQEILFESYNKNQNLVAYLLEMFFLLLREVLVVAYLEIRFR